MKKNWTLHFDLYRDEIKTLSDSLRDTKYNVLRKSHVGNGGPVAVAMFTTHQEKARVTLLCSVRAHHRNKVHQQGMTLEQQEAYLDKHSAELTALLTVKEVEEETVEAVEAAA